jgi:hypothetical protein
MRGRILALGAAFGLFGCTAVLGLDERPLDPNAEAGVEDASVDGSVDDAFAPEDTSEVDARVQDSEPADTFADTASADTSIGPDTSKTDTGKDEPDTFVADTFVADTLVPDTAVTDTGADSSGGPVLTITTEPTTAVEVNLTAEGTVDWAHWGFGTVDTFTHRLGPGVYIQKGAATGSAGTTALSMKKFSWSNGTPTAAASTSDGLVFGSTGEGYTFDVAASPTKSRTLRLYVGWYNRAKGTISATLSDGSAPPVMVSSGGTATGVEYTRFVVTFRSAATATVTIQATRTTGTFAGGSLDFFAATLQ